MSTDDESELKELVIQTLETSGVLSQIRAQLRASVFLALEEATTANTKKPIVNADLREYISTPKGKRSAHLIRDFLQFFNLKSTLSVFDSETSFGRLCDEDSRQSLLNELDVADTKSPLLDVIVEKNIGKGLAKFSECNPNGFESNPLQSRKLEPIGGFPSATSSSHPAQPVDEDPFFGDPVSHDWVDHFPKVKLSPMLEKEAASMSIGGNEENAPNRLLSNTIVIDRDDSSCINNSAAPNEMDFTTTKGNDARTQDESLGDLKIVTKSASCKPLNEYYDEDFQSSISLQSNQKTENDLSSEGEIEESLSEIGDELSVSYVHSQEQNSTVDNSVSQLCGKADYTENII